MIPNRVSITIGVPADVAAEFKAVCAEEDDTMSRAARRLIINYLIVKREEKEKHG